MRGKGYLGSDLSWKSRLCCFEAQCYELLSNTRQVSWAECGSPLHNVTFDTIPSSQSLSPFKYAWIPPSALVFLIWIFLVQVSQILWRHTRHSLSLKVVSLNPHFIGISPLSSQKRVYLP
jgi:hypothetical protein